MLNKVYEKSKQYIKENKLFLTGIFVILFLFFCPTPYMIYTPGGIVSLEDRIEVAGGYESEGSFNMAYVSMMKGSIPFILFSKIMPNWELVKKSDLTSDGNINSMIDTDKISMQASIDVATYKAFTLASKKVEIIKEINHITYISEEANTDLKLLDQFISVNDVEIKNIYQLREVIKEKNEGDQVVILVNRNGKEIECHARIYNTEEGLKIGVAFETTYELETDPKVTVKTKGSESGPSGGLMLALDIYNQLVEEDITKGRKIVGTGTIDFEGNVGAIGGVKYKVLGAAKKKADIFLVPEENYEEAKQVKEDNDLDIELISVKTLEEAIEALTK